MLANGLVHLVVSVGFSCSSFALDKLPLYEVSNGSPNGLRASVYDKANSRVTWPSVTSLVAHMPKDREEHQVVTFTEPVNTSSARQELEIYLSVLVLSLLSY